LICILHGYLLEGSGSNLWTQNIVKSLCQNGEIVHLVCQENHPEMYDFISESYSYSNDGTVQTILKRDVPYHGRCIMHKPQFGDILPVYVWDKYEEFSKVVPMIELSDDAIDDYLNRNTKVVRRVVNDFEITALHANHAVLMSVVAMRVSSETGIPYAIMPHGSAIEHTIKKDVRFLNLAKQAFAKADRIFVVGAEMQNRVEKIFSSIPDIKNKLTWLNLGVDTSLFKPIKREQRQNNIEILRKKLKGLPRGKKSNQSKILRDKLSSRMEKDEFQKLIESTWTYDAKCVDEDVESKLNLVDWTNDKIILFLGRIISSKGLQAIIAALPLIFAQHPNARLVVVGHGPLREPMDAFLWALENNERNLVKNIIRWGESLEVLGQNPFSELISFYDQLEKENELDAYYEKASKTIRPEKIIFTGYLKHDKLRYLFPCCDVAIFPSIVKEAGPLVFLEALASGCFPIGTYFGGMAASIDSVATKIPAGDTDLMKISNRKDQMVFDIVKKTQNGLLPNDKTRKRLSNITVELYDWNSVSKKLSFELNSLENK